MKDSMFWRGVAVLGVVSLFYVGHGLHQHGDYFPLLEQSVSAAGTGTGTESTETILTSSADGKIVYVWQYFSSRPPKYIGKTEAVLNN